MLRYTFIHAPGVGYITESLLWRLGVLTWEDLLAREPDLPLPAARRHGLGQAVRQAVAALDRGDAAYFARALPPAETWRAFPEFAHAAAFLDIETTGTGAWDTVTVVGLYDGEQVHTFVRGRNLEALPAALQRYRMLITFYGRCFDLPMLRRCFPQVDFEPVLHVDLCFALRRLGLRGGLKAIERRLGLARSGETADLDGYDAVRLWQAYQGGSQEALDLLVRYNTEDIVHLRPLMAHAYAALRARLLPPATTGPA